MLTARRMLNESAAGNGQIAEAVPIADESAVGRYVAKWNKLLVGLDEELGPHATPGQKQYVRGIAALMIEQEVRHLKRLNEETRALSVGPFMKYVLPVIRRTAVRLVATQISSVQPMTGPIGGIAFYRPRYASDKGSITAGTEMNKVFNKWYSSNFIDGEPFFTGDGTTTQIGRNLQWPRPTAGTVVVKDNGVVVATDNGSGGFNVVAGTTMAGGSGSINYQSGLLQLNFGTAPPLNDAITIEYRYDNELNSRIPEVQLDIEIKEIRAESRKLKSLASVEAADDLRALWGRDVDADLVAQMSDEMTAEIDREIAGTALNAVEQTAVVQWDRATPSGVSDPEHLKSLVIRLSRASHIVHRRTQRAPANWIITSSEMASLFDNIDGFVAVEEGHVYQGGIIKQGVLQRKWVVFIDPLFPQNQILMGYQGPSILDTGLIYSPYIPMEITPNFIDPNDLSLRRAVRTRHKITLTRPEFFARVEVDNLT
jgi:hypothetical protein